MTSATCNRSWWKSWIWKQKDEKMFTWKTNDESINRRHSERMGYIDLSKKQRENMGAMTSQTEARLQLPKTNTFVRTNNLLSDTWLLQREFYPCRWEAGLVRRAGLMWCFSSIRQWKSVKSIETQVPRLVCGVRLCHWVVRLGFIAFEILYFTEVSAINLG